MYGLAQANTFFSEQSSMKTSLKNFGFRRKSGILMPISSLPGAYGIGSLGKSAYDFVDFLTETKTKCWQVLPLNPTSYGDSPYQSPASVAGNPYFIDLDILYKKRLLTKDDLKESKDTSKRIDYGRLFNTRYVILRRAYARFLENGEHRSVAYKTYLKKNKHWLPDYSLFMALKVNYNYSAWTSWADEHKDVNKAREHRSEFKTECGFWEWIQFEFDTQWQALLLYAHSKGILIIGDMPIYVAHDSMDVWQAPKQFLLDSDFNPKVVAGCPPDGFSPDGQLWGNPIYNWELMEEEGFEWWIKRVRASFHLYDILRIDHFRGFAGYYNVPYGHTTAREGKWDSAPGIQLFRTIKEAFPKAKIIAEDLGFITDDVRALLDDSGFPGMKMLQFAFYDDNSEYLPRTYANPNCVAYPGSHDADCVKTWCKNLNGPALRRFNSECPRRKGQSRGYDLIEFAMDSPANLTVVPMQDYLELTNEQGRMNTPAVAEGNWTWRISPRYRTDKLIEKIKNMTTRTKRAVK